MELNLMGPLLVLVCPCFYRGNVIITCKIVCGGRWVWGGVYVCVRLPYLSSEDLHMTTPRMTPRTLHVPRTQTHTGPRKTLAKNTENIMFYHLRGSALRGPQRTSKITIYIWGHSSPRKYKQNRGVCMCQWGEGVFVCVCFLCVLGCVCVGCALGCVGCVIKQYYPIFPLLQILICSNIIINAMGLDPTFGNLCGKHPPTNWVPPPRNARKMHQFFNIFKTDPCVRIFKMNSGTYLGITCNNNNNNKNDWWGCVLSAMQCHTVTSETLVMLIMRRFWRMMIYLMAWCWEIFLTMKWEGNWSTKARAGHWGVSQ